MVKFSLLGNIQYTLGLSENRFSLTFPCAAKSEFILKAETLVLKLWCSRKSEILEMAKHKMKILQTAQDFLRSKLL